MVFIYLLIFSHDRDYSLALSEGLSSRKNNFIITVCKSEDELSDSSGFDLLIIDAGNSDLDEKFKNDKRVIRLADSRAATAKNTEAMNFTLYKYAGISELSADILLYYSLLTGKRNFSWPDKAAKVIAFCGGKGGVGKTATAFQAAQVLCRYHKKSVLYVSLEEMESTLSYIEGRDEGLGLCEYLYYLFKTEAEKPDLRAFVIRDKYGIEAFMPDKGRNRLRELNQGEMAVFFKEIASCGEYDYILADMGESFCEELKYIFSVCHKAVAVLSAEYNSDERERRFLNYLRFVIENEPVTICNNLDDDFEFEVKKMVRKIL
jgi:cellulose biosynthesis protein BcsQ